MATRLRKTRKKRGHVCAGYGRVGKHRLHPGGRGNAGGQHHHRSWFDKYHPGYFGKVGMRTFHRVASRTFCPIVNVSNLMSLLPADAAKATQTATQSSVPVIDVVQHGAFKVVGKGHVPKGKFIVKARYFTSRAEKKIKEAGGACVLTA